MGPFFGGCLILGRWDYLGLFGSNNPSIFCIPLCKNMMPSHLSLYSTFTTTSHHHLVVYADMSSLLCNELSIYIPHNSDTYDIPNLYHLYPNNSDIYRFKIHQNIDPSQLQGNTDRLRASGAPAWISARWRSTWASEKNIFLGLAIMATVLIMTKSLKKKH